MKNAIFLLFFFFKSQIYAEDCSERKIFFDQKINSAVSFQKIAKKLTNKDIVLVGETHDGPNFNRLAFRRLLKNLNSYDKRFNCVLQEGGQGIIGYYILSDGRKTSPFINIGIDIDFNDRVQFKLNRDDLFASNIFNRKKYNFNGIECDKAVVKVGTLHISAIKERLLKKGISNDMLSTAFIGSFSNYLSIGYEPIIKDGTLSKSVFNKNAKQDACDYRNKSLENARTKGLVFISHPNEPKITYFDWQIANKLGTVYWQDFDFQMLMNGRLLQGITSKDYFLTINSMSSLTVTENASLKNDGTKSANYEIHDFPQDWLDGGWDKDKVLEYIHQNPNILNSF